MTGYTIGDGLPKEQGMELNSLVQEYQEVTWLPGKKLAVVNVGVEHCIRLKPGSQPKASKP